jgi:hypothetical protein
MIYLLHITQRFVSKLKSNVQKSSYMLQYAKKTVCFASCFFRKDETNLMISFSCCNHYPISLFCLRFFQQVSTLNLMISFWCCNILPLWIFRFFFEIKGNVILVEHIHRAESLQHVSTPVALSLWFVSRENWTWIAGISFCTA